MSNFLTPNEVIEANINGSITKAKRKILPMFLLSIMAGMFIAFGGSASNVAVHNIQDVGISRTIAGTIFPVGLMMIVFVGAELFTGNCLLSLAALSKKVTWKSAVINLVVVYIGNFLGALILDTLVFYSGQLNYTNGALGAYTIKVALTKVNIEPITAFVSGILCNMLVCIAILMATAAKDIAGKVLAIFFPIWAFVISGFEHCVANMFYIPMGLFAKLNPTYIARANELYNITEEQVQGLNIGSMFHNLLPVTLGNIVGGAVIISVLYYFITKYDKK